MINNNLKEIFDRILKEQPVYGKLAIKLFFHNGKFVKYIFSISDTTLVKEENE